MPPTDLGAPLLLNRELSWLEFNARVLAEIGAAGVPQILVWNKIDLDPRLEPGLERDEYAKIRRVRLSAKSAIGLDFLRQALIETAASKHSLEDEPRLTGA